MNGEMGNDGPEILEVHPTGMNSGMKSGLTSPVYVFRRAVGGGAPTWKTDGTGVSSFRDEDLDEWLQLQNDVFRPRTRPWTRRDFDRELAARPHWNPAHLLLVRDPDNVVGSVYLESTSGNSVAQLHWLAVAPNARRQAIGTRLIGLANQLAANCGATHLRAETLATWNSAIRFYQQLGFERLE